MGEVIRLADHRQARRPAPRQRRIRVEFLFDLACPFTYLAAERVERAFDDVTWDAGVVHGAAHRPLASDEAALEGVRSAADQRARELRLPLVWPERWPADVPAAMRVASHAAECGRGAAFVLAAGRPPSAAASTSTIPRSSRRRRRPPGSASKAACGRPASGGATPAIESAGRRLLAVGADRLPALRAGRSLYWGEGQVTEAAAAARIQAAAARRLISPARICSSISSRGS